MKNIRVFLNKYAILFMTSFVSLFLLLIYMQDQSYSKPSDIDYRQLFMWLKNTRPYMTLDPVEKPIQEIFTKIIFYSFFLVFIISIYYRVRAVLFSKGPLRIKYSFISLIKSFTHFDFWLIMSAIILLLYFTFPEHLWGGCGYVAVRLEPVFFLFLILWISSWILNKRIVIFTSIVILVCSFSLNYSYYVLAKENNVLAMECNNAGKYINPGCTLSAFNFSDNWYYYSITDYAGVDSPVIVLDDYECYFNWFPLQWNNSTLFKKEYGNFISASQFSQVVRNFTQENYLYSDYTLIFEDINIAPDSIKIPIKKVLSENYKLKFKSDHCQLYEKI